MASTTAAPSDTTSEGQIEIPPDLKRIGVPTPLRQYIHDLWTHRDFLITVPLGELRAQNQNTAFGNLWHLLNPLLLAGVYYLIFGIIFNAARDILYYPAFLIIGIMTFTYIGKVMQMGARTVVANIKLIQSIQFPRASLPIATGISEFIAHVPAVFTMMVLVTATSAFASDKSGHALPVLWPMWGWLYLIPATILISLFGLGLAFFTARATFHFRDVQQFLPYVLRIWMYLSGMFYDISFVEKRAHSHTWIVTLFKLNPMWEFFEIFRNALIHGHFSVPIWAAATGWTGLLLVTGFMWFRAHEVEYSRGF